MRVVKKTDTELVLEIIGEDHTLGNMFVKQALKHPDVSYASYRIPHPLQNKLEIYLVVRNGSDIGSVIKDIVNELKSYLREFRDLVEEVL